MDKLPQQTAPQEAEPTQPTLSQIEEVASASGRIAVRNDASLGPDPVRRPLPPNPTLPKFS